MGTLFLTVVLSKDPILNLDRVLFFDIKRGEQNQALNEKQIALKLWQFV